MACINANMAWITKKNPRRISFRMPQKIDEYRCIELPCGKCIECRRKQTKEWAVRICHEAELHDENCFLTLTYNNENCPDELKKEDLQLFFKRLRKELNGKKIRYFACGEYGENYERPHYHIILFGLDISNNTSYNILDLERTWGKGYVSSGTVNEASASYVAGYVQKKLEKKQYVDESTGFIRQQEFVLMSRGRGENKGIGYLWIQKNHVDTYKDDTIIQGYNKSKPPRYYDKVVLLFRKDDIERIKDSRIEKGMIKVDDFSSKARESRELIAKAKIKNKRGYENG